MGAKDKKDSEKYFSIIIEQFDDYLQDTFGGFIFEDNVSESALVWGMPYIYELNRTTYQRRFLMKRQITLRNLCILFLKLMIMNYP